MQLYDSEQSPFSSICHLTHPELSTMHPAGLPPPAEYTPVSAANSELLAKVSHSSKVNILDESYLPEFLILYEASKVTSHVPLPHASPDEQSNTLVHEHGLVAPSQFGLSE
jgi:hypothetical protein